MLNKNCNKEVFLYEFSLCGLDFVSVVLIIEGPYIEVIFTKNVWAFSWDQVNCLYYRGVRKERFDCIFIWQRDFNFFQFRLTVFNKMYFYSLLIVYLNLCHLFPKR